jgi:hypothetical protein
MVLNLQLLICCVMLGWALVPLLGAKTLVHQTDEDAV